jgi:hypothetical protein
MPPDTSVVILSYMESEPEYRWHCDDTSRVAGALCSIPLFSRCRTDEVNLASRLLRSRIVPPAYQFKATELAVHSYIVVGGLALCTVNDRPPILIAHGDLFGLLRFAIDDSAIAATTAVTTMRVLVADEAASAQLLRIDGVARALVHGEAGRRRARFEGGSSASPWRPT